MLIFCIDHLRYDHLGESYNKMREHEIEQVQIVNIFNRSSDKQNFITKVQVKFTEHVNCSDIYGNILWTITHETINKEEKK